MKTKKQTIAFSLSIVTLVAMVLSCEKPIEKRGTLYFFQGQLFYDCAQTLPVSNKSGTLAYSYQKIQKKKTEHVFVEYTSNSDGKLNFTFYAVNGSKGQYGAEPNTMELEPFINNLPHAKNLNIGKVSILQDFYVYYHIKPEQNYTNLDTLYINHPDFWPLGIPIPGPLTDTIIGPFHYAYNEGLFYRNGNFGYDLHPYAFLRLQNIQQNISVESTPRFICNCTDSTMIDLVVK